MKILIVVAEFYKDIAENLIKGAIAELSGIEYNIIKVPGALEIPMAINLYREKFDGFIALGCVIKGETDHYEYVCNEAMNGITKLVLEKNLIITNGILTVQNKDLANARADVARKNKGGEVAKACLRMLEIKNSIK